MEKEKFKEKESFMHRYAKELLANQLSELEKNEYCEFGKLKWRPNYGIFTELKFYETTDVYYFEQSKGLKEYAKTKSGNDSRGKNPLLWFDDSIDRGKILFVPDITIFHKGAAKYFIEIVHTNSVSEYKKRKLVEFDEGIEVYEVCASEILSNIVGGKLNINLKMIL